MELNLFLSSSSSSSSSSESSDGVIEVVNNLIVAESVVDKTKNQSFVEETVALYSSRQFVEHFRLNREAVQNLTAKFENSEYYPKKDTGYARIGGEKCILAFLWYASNESVSYRDVADRFNLSASTLHQIIDAVTRFLSSMASDLIVWPSAEECRRISNQFGEMGFPGAIGVIDGTHIRIDKPNDDPDSYLNRKKYYSLQAQLVCDATRKIRDVFIGYPGSVHDARVFRNSPLYDSLPEKCREWFILGDSAYPCLRNLLTPYKDTGHLTNVQKHYNRKLSHCRVVIEHTIGLLKQRFRQLYHLKSKNIDFMCHFIRACCVLHNMCLDGMEMDIEDEPHEAEQQIEEQGEDAERNEVGQNYRNYIASLLDIWFYRC